MKIIVVDDEPTIANTTAAILRMEGYEATPFVDPLEALNSLVDGHRPDLLVTDFSMPQMLGSELALMIAAHCPSCAVLAITAHPNARELSLIKLYLPKLRILEKPVLPPELIAAVRETASLAGNAGVNLQSDNKHANRHQPPGNSDHLPQPNTTPKMG